MNMNITHGLSSQSLNMSLQYWQDGSRDYFSRGGDGISRSMQVMTRSQQDVQSTCNVRHCISLLSSLLIGQSVIILQIYLIGALFEDPRLSVQGNVGWVLDTVYMPLRTFPHIPGIVCLLEWRSQNVSALFPGEYFEQLVYWLTDPDGSPGCPSAVSPVLVSCVEPLKEKCLQFMSMELVPK